MKERLKRITWGHLIAAAAGSKMRRRRMSMVAGRIGNCRIETAQGILTSHNKGYDNSFFEFYGNKGRCSHGSRRGKMRQKRTQDAEIMTSGDESTRVNSIIGW